MQWHGLSRRLLLPGLIILVLAGCGRSRAVKEPPITGRPSDPPLTLQPNWEPGKRYIYRVDVSTTALLPRRVTGKLMRAETTLGQDLAFSVTNAAGGSDGRVIRMELLAVQMQTARDDGVTMTFDSDNPAIFIEDSALADRLQKLVGLKMTFFVSGENRITRVDGMRDLTDRMSGNSVRGVAGNVLSRFFNQQFFRDIIEMGLLPRDPIKVKDKWTLSRQVSGGQWGGNAQLDLNYEFRGWQRHDGTNCARLDFSGTLKPPGAPSNQPPGRKTVVRLGSSSEQGTVSGQCWYNPELALAIDTVYELSVSTHSTSVRRMMPAPKGGTNRVVLLEAEPEGEVVAGPGSPSPSLEAAPSGLTGGPPPPGAPGTPGGPDARPFRRAPPPPGVTGVTNFVPDFTNVTTNTTSSSSQWHTNVRLLEIEPLQ
jgi:hypothetical protein